MKAHLILLAVRFVMLAIALGVGIWYLSSSIGGAALTYSSMDNFLVAIGAGEDVASANGCFLCRYIGDLFGIIGGATEMFWERMLDTLLVIMALGFGLYLVITGIFHVWNATKDAAKLDDNEKKINFRAWFDKVVKQGIRVLFCVGLIGGLGMGGVTALKVISNVVITPVLFVGGQLAMAATGVAQATQCGALIATDGGVLSSVLGPFMCVIGNINSVMLAGAAGGFAMMNYAWLGMGGGILTWVAGLALVITFLIIGFDLFFQILSVVFKLIFLIIFMPFLLAAYAFEGAWKVASGLVGKGMNMLINSAIKIVVITLKVVIVYATVSYAADATFPGPVDGYSAMLPPMLGKPIENPDAQTLSVMKVFADCEQVALADGKMDQDKFTNCFTAQRAMVERQYPGAFDFLDDGWDFLILMLGVAFLYFYVIKDKVEGLLAGVGGEDFDFGGQIKQLGKNVWGLPTKIAGAITEKMGK